MYTILVVDDEKDIVSALEIYLRSEGYRVLSACNGKEALTIAGREDVHLVLMDIMMPVMDGITAARTIRAAERPDAQTIPIIAMTANAFEEDAKKCLAAGMNAHIAKPLDIDKVIAAIARFAGKK